MKFIKAVTITTLAVALGSCATSKSVDEKIAAAQATTNQRLESVSGQVEDLQEKQKATDVRVDQLSQTAQDALRRAQEAGVLAKGKVVFEQSFSEDRVKFKSGSATLDSGASAALDEFAAKVKASENQYWVEIQGHTDNMGGTSFNDELGQRRAEAVRLYLSRQHQIPLARMSTISYGETAPVDSNKTRAGRAANRRVVLVVLE
jgi:peptidoglycan-associated lipoprotein